MMTIRVAAVAFGVTVAGTSHAASDWKNYAAQAARAKVSGEARWIRAERDKANAWLARDFVQGGGASNAIGEGRSAENRPASQGR